MATIYIDSSEAREGTSLPNADSYISVSNLEHYTGGDILVSPWDDLPRPLRRDFPPHRTILGRHCQSGCLIQRKSGSDLLGSINKLDHILYRMSQWSKNPWLVYTRIRQTKSGMATVTGSRRKSNWHWKSVSGKLDAWRDNGGSVKSLPTDEDMIDWLESRCRAVDKWQENPEKLIGSKIPQQAITVRSEEQNWFNTLRLFPPGVGDKCVARLAVAVEKTLELPPTEWIMLQFACSEDSLKVKGWGKSRMISTRNWSGCDGTILHDGRLYELGDMAIADLAVMIEKRENE
jgi:hypothetical protein